MKKMPWSKVRSGMQACQPAADPVSKDEFWKEFRARASMTQQIAAQEPGVRWQPVLFRTSVGLAAAAAVMVVAFFVVPVRHHAGNQIQSLEIVAPHTGVMILNDSTAEGTIVWVTGMNGV